jgi:glutamate dehydrogenase
MAMADSRDQTAGDVPKIIKLALDHDARLKGFAASLFASVPLRDVEALGQDQLREIAEKASEAISQPFDGGSRVDVVALETSGRRPRALVRILNRDMPFLVDSAMNALQDLGIDAQLLMHPVFRAKRLADGSLEALAPATHEDPDPGEPITNESLIVIVVDNLIPEQSDRLISDIDAALKDVASAVADWRPMLDRLDATVRRLEGQHGAATDEQVGEAVAFCRWMLDGQFVFLGMREYALDGDIETGELSVVDGSNLGVLRDPEVQVLRRGTELVAMTPEIRRFYFAPQPIFITKSNVISRVHRSVHMDYVGLKIYGDDGKQTGELRIVGLFTSKVYTTPPAEIPLLRVKAERVIADAGYVPGSHDAKALVNVIDTFPRDELFQIPLPTLSEWVPEIVELESRPRSRLFFRTDRFHRFVSALVFIPRERFSTAVREKIAGILSGAFGGQIVFFQPFFTEGRLVRVHFIVARFEGEIPEVDARELEEQIAEASRSWRDRLANAIAEEAPDRIAQSQRYCAAFPASYTETHDVARALVDAERIDGLSDEVPLDIRLTPHVYDNDPATTSAVIYSRDRSLPLSERVPVFEQMGFRVLDEQTFRINLGASPVSMHDMRLRPAAEPAEPLSEDRARALEACFEAVQSGAAESDRFNGLILTAGCSWREAAMVRAYALYARQTKAPYGPNYMAETLNAYPGIAALLIKLFAVRFDPDNGMDMESRAEEQAGLRVDIESALAEVPGLDEDRILRTFVMLITGTLRTNFYQRGEDGGLPPTIAFKVDPSKIDLLPEPRPYREIWVYSPEVEGVHLRFAPIARGGLRWSDRAQDFRTEVLGLAKAQQVKNTVIVPEGAKGGFFPKRLPKSGTRDEVRAAGVSAYRSFIGTMLDITDNIVDGEVVQRDRVVRHDGDDPYLVVAADKGTATFSDYANAISQEKGHWLGDAFASGGSAGYDHKAMGITARGGWECVKRHFREMDRDIQTEPFTVVGVGDMSGDVFGNGMLLSPVTRLIAAFNHRDIFIDPDPDPATSFAERKRLFELGPPASWSDYDKSKLSKGGGVFPRTAKSIELSDEIRAALGIEDRTLTPNKLMNAILKAPVDLMWLGGIGTYVRATYETDADADDRSNDPIRVTAPQVRAKVIGEGANLGLTQPGRVEFAAHGGRLNTDFIDNSAGVNSSDIEVNIKIALGAAVAAGKLDIAERNELLKVMTEEVARNCLWNNRQQSLAISLATRDSVSRLGYLSRLMDALEDRGLLDRSLEDLPGDDALIERQESGRGLERPEVSVLLSYAKIALSADLMRGALADDPAFEPLLFEYFPTAMQQAYRDEISGHRLRKEIIVTRITNSIINRAGPSSVVRLSDETGRTVGEIARALMATRAVFGLPEIWAAIDQLDNQVPGEVQLGLYADTQELLLDQAGASLRTGGLATLNDQIAADRPAVQSLRDLLGQVSSESQRALAAERATAFQEQGVPADVAEAVARLELLRFAPAIRGLVSESGATFELAAKAMFDVADQLDLLRLRARVRDAGYSDYYDRLASASAMSTIEKASVHAARSVLGGDTGATAKIDKAAQRLGEVVSARTLSVSRLTVSASQIRDLMET